MPNLKEARMSVGRLPNFNVGEHLRANIGLQHLHLVLQAGSGSCDLRQELEGRQLPASLSKVTLEAAQIPSLHPAALKVTSQLQSLIFIFINKLFHPQTEINSNSSNSPRPG